MSETTRYSPWAEPGAVATGGPKQIQNLYTREMLEEAFSDFDDLRIVEEEREIAEGTSHLGMSALIGLTGRKPKRQEHQRIRRLRMPPNGRGLSSEILSLRRRS